MKVPVISDILVTQQNILCHYTEYHRVDVFYYLS